MATSRKSPAMLSTRQVNKGKRHLNSVATVDDVEEKLSSDAEASSDFSEPENVSDVTATNGVEDQPPEREEEVMSLMDKVQDISSQAEVNQQEISRLVGNVDLQSISTPVLIELAVRFTEAAEIQHRQHIEQQRQVTDRIAKLVSSFGVHTQFNLPSHVARPSRVARFIFRNPDDAKEVWQGIGAKPTWLKKREEMKEDISKFREPNPNYVG